MDFETGAQLIIAVIAFGAMYVSFLKDTL